MFGGVWVCLDDLQMIVCKNCLILRCLFFLLRFWIEKGF